MNRRTERRLKKQASYIAEVVRVELGLEGELVDMIRNAIYTALYAIEESGPASKMFMEFYRARIGTEPDLSLTDKYLRLVEFFESLERGG